ncbi:MAG: hypothetical protein ACXACI_09300 [Candidatus Hodarchaeales archaeon]|jgi:DNA-binding Lrp family transcriptional regulator
MESANNLLNSETNLKLLTLICSGVGVEINISELSLILKKHRKTIQDRVNRLFEHKIINKPVYPLSWLMKEYPFMVISKSKFPRDEKTKYFIEYDPQIFAAFFYMEENYNTLMIEYHKDLFSYEVWRDSILEQEKISLSGTHFSSDAIFLSARRMVRFDSSVSINLVKQNVESHRQTTINGFECDSLSFKILKLLMYGKGIRTNKSYLAKKLGIHRRTIERRLQALLEEKIVSMPVCFFPRMLAPPEYMIVLTLIKIQKQENILLKALQEDIHIPMIIKAKIGRYNLFLLSTFYKIEDHLEWQEKIDQRFPECIGSVQNTYLSPTMTFSIIPEYISLELIKSKLRSVRGKKMAKTVKKIRESK